VRPPDLRVVVRGEQVVVRPWRQEMRWADLYRRKLRLGPLEFIRPPHGTVVGEVWVEGSKCIVRWIGSNDDQASERLSEWARQWGLRLVTGRPLPEVAAEYLAVSLTYDEARPEPDFRFVYRRSMLRVVPTGFASDPASTLYEPFLGATGDIVALDDDQVIASPALCRCDPVEVAEALERWAKLDGWTLALTDQTQPLGRLRSDPHPLSRVCTTCGDALGSGWAAHMAFSIQGWVSTRCNICWGRVCWNSTPNRGAGARP
jgi:hypothetical protein